MPKDFVRILDDYDKYIDIAKQDFRDVLFWAEYQMKQNLQRGMKRT
jgi:hypothetical protein